MAADIYAISAALSRSRASYPVVAIPTFHHGAHQVIADVVRPVPVREEVTVGEVDTFRRAFIRAQGQSADLWRCALDPNQIITWFSLNLHQAHRMTESISQVVTLLWKHKNENDSYQLVGWEEDVAAEIPWSAIPKAELVESEDGVEQSRFDLSDGFLPSAELLSIWTECLKELALSGGRKNVEMALASASAGERSHQFASMFRSAIGSFAQYLRYEEVSAPALVANGRIEPVFQQALSEQFHIIPDRAARFLELLSNDFLAAMNNGWQVEADWGQLKLGPDKNISLILKPLEYFDDPDFVESEDVE